MKKLTGFLGFLFIIGLAYFFSESKKIGVEVDKEVTDDVEDSNSEEEKTFFNYNSWKSDSICDDCEKRYKNCIKSVDNYIQRYISLFLITSNLMEYSVRDLDEKIIVDLEISITGDELAFLQKYSKMGKPSFELSHSRKLFKLDKIFSKIARAKEKSYLQQAFTYLQIKSLAVALFSKVTTDNFIWQALLPIPVIMLFIMTIYFFIKSRVMFYIKFTVHSFLLWESYNLYWKRVKELDLDIYVKMKQFKNSYDGCDPDKITWYDHIWNLFSNRCHLYHQTVNKDPRLEVSFFKCIIDTYAFHLLQTPVKILGSSLKDFSGEVGKLFPWPLNYLVEIPLAVFFFIVFILALLVLLEKQIKMSCVGFSLNLSNDIPSIQKEETPQVVEETREIGKLKQRTSARLRAPWKQYNKKNGNFFLKQSRDNENNTKSTSNEIINNSKEQLNESTNPFEVNESTNPFEVNESTNPFESNTND